MASFDIITVGGAVRDFTFYTEYGKIISTPNNLTAQRLLAFEYGAKIDAKEAYISWGGGANNTAVSFARLGFKVVTLVRIGCDELGDGILANLKKEKINTSLVQFDGKAPTGFSAILVTDKKDREHIAFMVRGANIFLNLSVLKSRPVDSKWLYLTSLSGKNWLKNLKLTFDFAKSKNIKVCWNPGNTQLKAGKRILANFIKQTQVLILNKDEAIELALSGVKLGRKNPNHLNRPIYLLNILQEWGPKIVVITDGSKGAWAYDGKKIYRQNIVKAKVINTTGVGDAFGSAFIAGLMAKKDIAQALKWGMINSASVLTKIGAQNGLLSRKELDKRL